MELTLQNIERRIKTPIIPRRKDRATEYVEVLRYPKLYGKDRRTQKKKEGNERNLKSYQKKLEDSMNDNEQSTDERGKVCAKINKQIKHFQELLS